MARLSDTQLIILSAAAQRDDRIALPLPSNLEGGATKVIDTMVARGLLEEVEARIAFQAHLSDPVWRENGDGHGTTLVITDAGLAAIGIAPDELSQPDAPRSATGGDTGASADGGDHDATATDSAPTAPASAKSRTLREGTKQATLIAMLRAPDGATIAEIVAATGWQPHTMRGAIAGALKKKLGLTVTSEKVGGRGRVYRLPPT